MQNSTEYSYWKTIWTQFKKHRIGFWSFVVVILFVLIGLYAPFLASSKPFAVYYKGNWYFPLFKYLFFSGFYTKPIDIFYNLLMFTLPLGVGLALLIKKHYKKVIAGTCLVQVALFLLLALPRPSDPASSPKLEEARQNALKERQHNENKDPLLAPFLTQPGWDFNLKYMNSYAQLNLLLKEKLAHEQYLRLATYQKDQQDDFPSLWLIGKNQEARQIQLLEKTLVDKKEGYSVGMKNLPGLLEEYKDLGTQLTQAKKMVQKTSEALTFNKSEAKSFQELELLQKELDLAKAHLELIQQKVLEIRKTILANRQMIQSYLNAKAKLNSIEERKNWIQKNVNEIHYVMMPFLRPFHWEDDAGGSQNLNQEVNWWNLTRINRKDLVASLIFGVRISIVVGVTAVVFALAIGIPMGAIAGYFGGKSDLFISRLMEIWEAMPTFFMLLLIVAITQSKSIFLIVAVLGIFGWISIARFIRGEVLKQRNLTYVEACHSMGYKNRKIIFSHILPNAIPPVLTLLPFAVMAAIISEAGLSFLGLGEEGSTSWGVLMDEGRTVFPAESYLLWPPALLLTTLLVAIALMGDALRDVIDPKMR